MKSGKTIFAICALGLALPGTALAATPTATTGSAKNITATTATLTGTVDPNHIATNFHFEYGRTTTYGSGTPDGIPSTVPGLGDWKDGARRAFHALFDRGCAPISPTWGNPQSAFQQVLADQRVLGQRDRVVPVEAGTAQRSGRLFRRRDKRVERHVTE